MKFVYDQNSKELLEKKEVSHVRDLKVVGTTIGVIAGLLAVLKLLVSPHVFDSIVSFFQTSPVEDMVIEAYEYVY